ncbi:MAG: RagB/SusD family nutrient uptake outer membrane protein, partial [Gemmatimonadaceae bacterium]
VFNNTANTDAALVGTFKAYYALIEGTCPSITFSIWGNEMTSASVTYLDYSSEPRIPINNLDALNCATRYAYYNAYEAIAGAREAYQGIVANNLKFGLINATYPNGQDTPSRVAFAKFIIAIGQLNLGLQFDQAFITDITTPQGSTGGVYKPYKEVVANAVTQLRTLVSEMRAGPDFTLPILFVNEQTITRDDLVRICISYITRAEVYAPRTVADRNAVNWAAVLARLDSGITKDFSYKADIALSGTGAAYITNSFAQNTWRISNRLVGPSDTSGKYQAWLATPVENRTAFILTTPDRRIQGATNTTNGKWFSRLTTSLASVTLAPYNNGFYRSIRLLNASADSGSRALNPLMTVAEMKFIRAEALNRLGRGTEAAALINPTRVANNLQPVTASGPPAGRDCVPRKDDGTCGDLFDAIQYEKRIELFPQTGEISWYDARGWGKLVKGTPFQLPVSGRELQTLGYAYYTFGGVGQIGGAP